MSQTIWEIGVTTTILSALIPAVILWSRFNRQPLPWKWLAILSGLSCFTDIASGFLTPWVNPNISVLFYVLPGTLIVSFFFYYAIGWKKLRGPLIAINILYLTFGIVNALHLQKISLNSYTIVLHVLIILFLSICYFYKLLKELPAQQLQSLPLFWVVSGLFFTNAGKLCVYSITHYLVHFVQDNLLIIWTFHNFLSIIANLLIGYGAWLNHKQLRSTSLSL